MIKNWILSLTVILFSFLAFAQTEKVDTVLLSNITVTETGMKWSQSDTIPVEMRNWKNKIYFKLEVENETSVPIILKNIKTSSGGFVPLSSLNKIGAISPNNKLSVYFAYLRKPQEVLRKSYSIEFYLFNKNQEFETKRFKGSIYSD